MSRQVLLRRDDFENWSTINPILAQGEVGVDTTYGKIKIGTGQDRWNQIDYISYSTSELEGLLSLKSDTSHDHSGVYEPVIDRLSAFNLNFAGTGSANSISHSDHTHSNDAGIGGPYYTAAALSTSGLGAQVHWNNIIGNPLSYTPSAHTQLHTSISDWDTYVSTSVFAAASHGHNNDSSISGPYEAKLSNPSTNGYLLYSNTDGTKGWVTPYSLPSATNVVKGGVFVGTGLSVSSGTISVSYAGTSGNYGSATSSARSDHGHSGIYQGTLNGTGFVKASGTTISYDNSTYSLSSHTHLYAGSSSAGGAATSVANSITFVTTGGSPAASWNGSSLLNVGYTTIDAARANHTHTLDAGISDVVLTTPAIGDLLEWNGINWVNSSEYYTKEQVNSGTDAIIKNILMSFGAPVAAYVYNPLSGNNINKSGVA